MEGVALTPPPPLKAEVKQSRDIPLLPLCAFLSSYRAKFIFTFTQIVEELPNIKIN
jgi:hypothetical protein